MDAGNRHITVVIGGTPGLTVFGNEEQVARGRDQPRRQRRRLLGRRLDRAGLDQAQRGHGRDLGRRPGHRHPPRRAGPDLRAVLPHRPGPAPIHRRYRSRALHRQARRGHPRWRRTCVVPGGPGLDLHALPPPHPSKRSSPHDPRVLVVEDEESYADALVVHAPQGGVRRVAGRQRHRRARGVRPQRRRHRAARPDAARPSRHRGVPPDPRGRPTCR